MRRHNYMLRHLAPLAVAVFACLAAGPVAIAQRASPHETTSASVDGADLTISYGRPYMRGRTIFGALVPYGRVWCPGADEATTLTTTAPLEFGGLTLGAGSYTLWILPSAADWQLIVNRQTGQWHTQHDARQDLGGVALDKRTLTNPIEQLTFAIEKSPTGTGGVIVMRWATTEVHAPFTVVK